MIEYYASGEGRWFLSRQGLWLAASAFALLVAFNLTDLDREITALFFDPAFGGFPLTNDWWLKRVLHDAARTVSTVGALGVVCATVAAWLARRWRAVHAHRHELTFVSAAALISAAVVAALKQRSGLACPWDIADFGALASYGAPVEGCFPAAHPLVGYAWLGVGFALRSGARRAARIWMCAAFMAGTLAGTVQVVRGAHFVSHVLWTAWVVWAVNLALLAAACALRRGRTPSVYWRAASRRRA